MESYRQGAHGGGAGAHPPGGLTVWGPMGWCHLSQGAHGGGAGAHPPGRHGLSRQVPPVGGARGPGLSPPRGPLPPSGAALLVHLSPPGGPRGGRAPDRPRVAR
eukprot:1174401-Prorocentrum_minimum.AAC.1